MNKLNELCLEITNACQMNCLHCSANAGLPLKDEMKFSEIQSVITQFAEMGGKILELSGGEPLTHSNIFEFINHAKEHSLEVRLYSSGFVNGNIIKNLQNSDVDKVIFNLQGATKKIHESITNTEGSFRKTAENIRKLRSSNFWVGTHFVPMKPNIYEIKETAQFCVEQLNVSEFAILRFVPQGRGFVNREELELSKAELEYLFLSANEINSKYGKKTRIGRPFNIRSSCYSNLRLEKCNAGITKCLIKPNGDVAPCPAFKQNQAYVAGNINRNTLFEIWENSAIWRQFREFEHSKLMGCTDCRYISQCQGGCPAQRILAWNDIYQGPDPSCILECVKSESCGVEEFLQKTILAVP